MDRKRTVKTDPRRGLPAADRLIRQLSRTHPELPVWAATRAVREVLAGERERLAADDPTGAPGAETELLRRAAERGASLCAPHPRRVVNATGVVLHTNLGRAPLAPGAAAAAAAAAGYGDLELDLATGRRGDRAAAVAEKLVLLSGAEAAHPVNNNAGAVLLALDTLARGREVVVSRGELVEIGGSFRVPDIVARAGVRLVEVGTTNRTHPEDYERAIGERTALLLKVHRSNFEVRGFVSEVSLAELAEIGQRRGLPVVEDLGSATFVDLSQRGFPPDVDARARLRQGADVVCFSGDKLLGGPQAGIALGTARRVDAMRRNPLARALRLDKLTLAALDWTLEAYLDGRAEREIPVLRQLLAQPAQLEVRARGLVERLAKLAGADVDVSLAPDRTAVGGGSLPGFELDSWVVVLDAGGGAERLVSRLRHASVPVLARIRDDRVVLDVRTLLDGDEVAVEMALAEALGRPAGTRSPP
ncbi:MAG: L-seryl-tRNA(Sec) selenium transferase [Myxococcota bacterium]